MMFKKSSSKLQIFMLATISVSVLASLFGAILMQFLAANAEILKSPLGSFFQIHHLLSLGLALLIIIAASYIVIRRMAPLQNLTSFAERLNNLERPEQDLLATAQNDELSVLASSLRGLSEKMHNRFSFAEGVLKNLPNGICVANSENCLTFTNSPVLQFLELDGRPEDYFGMDVAEFFYNDSTRDTVTGKVYRQNQKLLGMQAEVQTHKGNTSFTQIDAAPLYDLQGNLIGSFGCFSDLSQLKEQEKEIQSKNLSLDKAAKQAKEISEQLSSSAEELAAQVEQASMGAEEQKKRASEASTAMEEMNSSIMEITKNATSSAEQAEKNKQIASEADNAVQETIQLLRNVHEGAKGLEQGMSEMESQAEGIGKIMNTITDIADQTNLLALNAAIEAARAGDAGRGFAVVADEVRKLAEKTMHATQEVGEYIQNIQDKTEKNVQSTREVAKKIDKNMKISGQAGEKLNEMLGIAQSTADQIRNIATAVEQQSSASEQISRSSEEVNRIAQDTADSMTQSSQAISDLSQLAHKLNSTIEEMRQD